jgi:hypothetical protein
MIALVLLIALSAIQPGSTAAARPGSVAPAGTRSIPAAQAHSRAGAEPGSIAAAPFGVAITLEPKQARTGDRLTLVIAVDATANIESVRPRLEERLGDFDVLSIDSTPMDRHDIGWRQEWRVTLAAFDTGAHAVPRFALDYAAAGGQTLAYWVDPRLSATITGPAVTADMPLRPLAGAQDPPPPSPWPRIALIGGILSVIVGVLSVPLVVWWLRTLRRRRQLAFFRQLQRELATLRTAPTDTPDAARAAYTRAAEILRRGVGRVAPGPTASLPSPELANHLARTGADGTRIAARLRTSLAAVDAVRFGNVAPTPHRHTTTIGEAAGVVQAMGTTAAGEKPKARAS